jgi:neutral trehalase
MCAAAACRLLHHALLRCLSTTGSMQTGLLPVLSRTVTTHKWPYSVMKISTYSNPLKAAHIYSRLISPPPLRPTMCRYYANWTAPRPESYREDAELARNVTGTSSPGNPQAAQLYRDLASGAETGWDYSSRWFADNKTLATVRTTQVQSTAFVIRPLQDALSMVIGYWN